MKKHPSYEAQKRKEFVRSHDFYVSMGNNGQPLVVVRKKETMTD